MSGVDPGSDWHPSIPTSIPSAPSLSIEYDSLSEMERIGTGGNADVFKAAVTRGDDRHTVAVKQPRFESTMHVDTLDRFSNEAETWDKLDGHPHIVGVVDWGVEPLPWLAMEYMDGGHLGDRTLPLDLAEALWLGQSLCRAVRHAHRRGVAHLDLKPANVLYRETEPDTWPAPKIGDWGLSKLLLEHSSTVTGYSPTYAAPEQVDPDTYGGADDFTDIYQVGALLYEALVGEPPFSGSHPAVIRAILEEEPVAPSDRNPDLPTDIDAVVLGALAKEKDDRPASIIHLRENLETVIDAQFGTDESESESSAIAAAVTQTGEQSGEQVVEPETGGDDHLEDESNGGTSVDRRKLLAAAGGTLALGGAAFAAIQGFPADSAPDDTSDDAKADVSGGVGTATKDPGETAGLTTPEPRTLKLGLLVPETGGLDWIGPDIRDAALLATQYIDQTSEVFTVDAQIEDTATDPNTGVAAAERLAQAGYPMYVGALASDITLAVAREVAIDQGLVGCSPSSTYPAISSLDDDDYIYRTVPSDEFFGLVMAMVGWERLQAQSVAILVENTSYGKILGNNFAKGWEDRGGAIFAHETYDRSQTSYRELLDAYVLDAKPDLLMLAGRSESGAQILRDFYANYSQDFCDILVSDGMKDPELPEQVDNSMRNVWGMAPISAGPGNDFFEKRYTKEYGREPGSPFLAYAFDAAAVLCLANAAAGENTGSAIREAMRPVTNGPGTRITPSNLAEGLSMAATGDQVNYQGVSGPLNFDDSGDSSVGFYELFRFNQDGIESVDDILYDL